MFHVKVNIMNIYLKMSVKILVLLSILLFLAIANEQHPENDNISMAVGQIVPGRIDPLVSNQKQHPIKIGNLEKKYLFIRLSTFDTNLAALGLYSKQTGQLQFQCMNNTFDTCYVPMSFLKADTEYVILVMSNNPINYNLYTYWADLQHLQPDQQIKFMFDGNDKTQLFHLELQNRPDFKQIRIVLRPQTMRAEGDNLKIFANLGFKEEPTQQSHDLQSVHVWDDAQAIFLTKEEVKDHNGIAIYIVGNAKTVYILTCEFIKQNYHNLTLNENLYEYINSNQQTTYYMKLQQSEHIDTHVVRFSVFTGEVQVGFFYDADMKRPLNKLPFQYMSDIQFHIEKEDLNKDAEQLYIKVTARDAACTFQLNVQGRKKVEGFQMYENVFEFVPIRQKQNMYFYSHIWNQNQFAIQKVHIFDISMIKAQGQSTAKFYLCRPNANEDNCKKISSQDFAQSTVQLKPIGIQEVGSKTIFSVQIEQKDYSNINSVQKRALIIIELTSVNAKLTYAAIEFSNSNKVRLLREGRAFQDKVRLSQKKYYKFQNDNPSVKVIRVHINQISGLTKIIAKRSDTRLSTGEEIKLDPQQPNTIVITKDLTKPIFIEIQGLVTSIYTVAVSTVHQEHPTSNSLVMAQDVQYQVKLMPYQHINVQIHPIQPEVVFEFSSDGGSILVCEIDSTESCKADSQFYGNKGELKVDASNARQVRIRLGNYLVLNSLPNSVKAPAKLDQTNQIIRRIKVTLRYHAKGSVHCQEKKINQIYSQVVRSGACFKFHLPLAADLQILASQQNIDESYQLYFLCSKKIVPQFSNDRFKIKGNLISESCQDLPNDMNLQIIIGDSTSHDNKPNDVRMDYSVQYLNDIITLADGVAYYTKTISLQSAIKTFFYDIVDETSSVQIVLLNKKGTQHFYAKVVQKSTRYNAAVTEAQATINSKSSNYYINPSIQVTKQHIEKANCGRNCQLVISVFSKQSPGTTIQFGIQVTQNQVILKEDQIKNDFLSKGSVKYYEYQSRNSPTDLLFKISDNNRRCARSYLSTHPFPSSSNNIMIENQGSLIYKRAQKGTYYFAVQALDDCPYSISVSEGDSKLTRIQHGQQYDIKLNEGEVKWFYLKHLSKSSFKIISLLKHGLVDISVTKTDLGKQVIDNLSKDVLKRQQFPFKNTYQNSLLIDSQAKQFCANCYYLVNIYARALTQGSIFLGSQNTKISLYTGKVLFDEIKQVNVSTMAIFYKISKGNIHLNVHSGKIKLQMKYEDQKFEQTYSKNKKLYNQTYTFNQIQGKYSPIQIKITAEETPAVYSLQLLPFVQNITDEINLNPGQSTQTLIKNDEPLCFKGTLRSKSEQIYLITDSDERVNLLQLKITAKLNGKQTQIQKQLIGNILSTKFTIKQTFFAQALKYQLCIQSNQSSSFFLNVLQNENMNLIPYDTQLMIRKQGTFAIHHSGSVIIDLFECIGKADVAYSAIAGELKTKGSNQLQVMGIAGQNHAIRAQSQQVLFLKAKAELATLLWMPLNQQKERGIGYYKYSIGKLSYITGFNKIQFIIGGVYKSRPTNTSVQSVKYTLYISNSRQLLQQGVMCTKTMKQKLFSIQVNSSKVGDMMAPQIIVELEKKKINDEFESNQTLYFNVVADLTLLPPNEQKQHEHYRFIYFQQIVLAELFRQNKIEEHINFNLLYGLVAVAVLGCLMISYVFVRWVAPAIGRLRNRVLVQENNDEQRQMEMQAPPSSDRNQMSTPTDERIN